MTGVRGVAALFLDSIWSSILPISFFRSLAAGSTVSQTLTNEKSVLSVSANQSTALPGIVQLSLSLTRGTENLLTWKLETKLFSSRGQRSKRDNYPSVHSCSLSRILPSESGRCWLYELRMTSWIRVRILKDRHMLFTVIQLTVSFKCQYFTSERANWRLVNVNLRWAKKASSSVSGPSIICWYQQWPKCGQVCIMRSCLTQARSQPEILNS